MLDSTHVAIAFHNNGVDDTSGIVGVISGTTITFGSVYQITATGDHSQAACQALDATHMAALYYINTVGMYLVIGTVANGDEISWGTPVLVDSTAVAYTNIGKVSSTRVVLAYRDTTAGEGRAILGNIANGNEVTMAESEYPFATSSLAYCELAMLDDTSVAIVYSDSGNSNYGTMIVGTIYGDMILFDTPRVFTSAAIPGYGEALLIDKGIIGNVYTISSLSEGHMETLGVVLRPDAYRITGDSNILHSNHIITVSPYTQQAGVRVQGSDNQILNNSINGASTLMQVGIVVDTGAVRTMVGNNLIQNCDDYGVINSGQYTLFSNTNTLSNNGTSTGVDTV